VDRDGWGSRPLACGSVVAVPVTKPSSIVIPAIATTLMLAKLEAMGGEVSFGEIAAVRSDEPAHVSRARHAVWLALRAERDERGKRRYTQLRVAEWFGVTRSAVSEAERVAKASKPG
jgi:hypothetical protein